MRRRLQKILSEYGISSRRASEELILAGRVTINGVPSVLGDQADPDIDQIAVDGKPLAVLPEKQYIMMNKPRGVVTTARDEQGRKTVLDLLPPEMKQLYPVGRLDLNSEGLLLLTNDGAFCQHLIHPSHQVEKSYLVWVQGNCRQALPVLNRSMTLEKVRLRAAKTKLLQETPEGGLLKMTIHEGKNRQIRRMCQKTGLSVTRLKRIAIGNLALKDLRPGEFRPLSRQEVAYLKES